MSHYPCEPYAKYLLLLDRSTALQKLMAVGFEYQAQHLDDLYNSISPVPTFTLPVSDECADWARAHQVYSMLMRPDSDGIQDILRIFRNHTNRPLLEALLMMNVFPEDVLNLFKDGTGVTLEEHTMKLYQHYFWNTRIMSRLDWHNFLFEPVGGQRIPRYANAGDLWSYLHLPASLALYKAGFTKFVKIDKAKALDDIFGTAYMKAMEEAQTGNVPCFQKAATVAIAAFEASKTTTSDINEVLHRLSGAVKLKPTEFEVTSIASVTGGHHSQGGNVIALSRRLNAAREPEGDSR